MVLSETMEQLVKRTYWLKAIEDRWRHRSILWLSGVRRTGKTSLAHSLGNVEYFDCELPRVRRLLEDPEGFLADVRGKRVVLDEIHRLRDPAQVLKIAADHFPTIRILATGSSTLGASRKFRDTLTGRKATLWLTPMLQADLRDFHQARLPHRLLRGGLPPFFLAKELPERDFQEWMDAYWAKDIQELFRLERRDSFQRFAELVMARSAGIFQAQRFAKDCEVAHGTIRNYLKVLEATLVAHVIRPFSTHRSTEIVSAPKVYAFDTGFVCYHRGWHELRREDLGLLWEHFVLNELQGCLQLRAVRYWRDKHGHEVDFVLAPRGRDPLAIECQWSAADLGLAGVRSFRHAYPKGHNFLVAQDATRSFTRRFADLTVTVLPLSSLVKQLQPFA